MSTGNDKPFYIKHSNVRILREALARIAFSGRREPMAAKVAYNALGQYAQQCFPDCECPEKASVPSEDAHACLDCGRRYFKTPEIKTPVTTNVPPEDSL